MKIIKKKANEHNAKHAKHVVSDVDLPSSMVFAPTACTAKIFVGHGSNTMKV